MNRQAQDYDYYSYNYNREREKEPKMKYDRGDEEDVFYYMTPPMEDDFN